MRERFTVQLRAFGLALWGVKMIKTSLQTLFCAVVLLGCASDASPRTGGASQGSSVPPPAADIGAAFFGLTVKDCYGTAVDCLQGATNSTKWVSETVSCQEQLRACFGDLVKEAVTTLETGAHEVAQCGHAGIDCFHDVRGVEAAAACRDTVETCVNGTVKDATGIDLPTTSEVRDAARDAVETAHGAVHEAAQDVAQAAHDAVDTAVTIHETAHTARVEAVENAVDTAVTVNEAATGAVKDTISAAIDAAGAVASTAEQLLHCAVQSRICMWDTADFIECSDAYQDCVGAIE